MSGSKIRLYGATSGFVELEAPDVAPDSVLTLPATAGGFGKLVAVKSAIFTGTQSQSTASISNFAITDLTITHALSDAANKLIISAFIGAAGTTHQLGNVGIAIDDGTGLIAIGDVDGTRGRVTAGGYVAGTVSNRVTTMPSVTFVHTLRAIRRQERTRFEPSTL
jgi:hypothetical protein